MDKITKEKCIELLIKSGCSKGHIIEKSKERHIACGDVYVCKGCHQYARFVQSHFDGQVWSPWEGTLISFPANVVQGIRQYPIMDDRECWDTKYQVKHLKDRLRRRVIAREVISKITNKLSRQETEDLINALMWDIDFEEVPENDGSEKRDAWPHASTARLEAA